MVSLAESLLRILEKIRFAKKYPSGPGNSLDSPALPLFTIVLLEKSHCKWRALFPRFTIVWFGKNSGKWRVIGWGALRPPLWAQAQDTFLLVVFAGEHLLVFLVVLVGEHLLVVLEG